MALTQIKTNAIADDAVTLAKQAAGTDGQIITYDASGNPVAVGPGTDGQVLTSTGAGSPPAFEALPASNNYTHPNHSGDVTSSGDGATTIANDAVTTAKIADDAITSALIADNAVVTAAIANEAVTFTKFENIDDGQILVGNGDNRPAERTLSGDVTMTNQGAVTIANNAVTLAKMAGGTDGQIITYDASGDPVAVGPGTDGQVLTSTGAGSPPAFEDAGGGLDGVTTGSGNVTITDGNLIVANGHGIDFSAQVDPYGTGNNKTTDSELLSYYETGEFDPIMSAGGTNFDHTGAHGAQDGIYTRVGNMVTCYFRLGWTGINSASGTLRLGGFPFNGANTPSGYYFTGTFADFWGFFTDGYNILYGLPNNNYLSFHSTHHTGPATTSHIGGSNGGFSGTITYIAKD